MEDRQAIALLKRGDLAGLEHLVRQHQVEAVHVAYLILRERGLAEDVVQACFLKAAERIHQFEPGRPFRPWFLRMVTNDSIKAASRAMRDLSLDAAQEMRVMPTWLRDANPGPEEQATTAEDRRMVWEALSQLTPKQRAAVVLRYFLDMRDREIARELDRSLSSIKWSIHAAKERLRSLLRRADPQEGSLPPKSKGDRGPGESR